MRFTVEAWDPSYGSPLDAEPVASSTAAVDASVESATWAPVVPKSVAVPGAILFVDGVRRIDARVWIDDAAGTASPGICASYGAGVVCCCAGRSHVVATAIRRSVVTAAADATDVVTAHGTYRATRTPAREGIPIASSLSNALQRQLYDVEVTTAVAARAEHDGDDLLVVDGPLRDRTTLPRTVGYIKTHHTEYLAAEQNAVVSSLAGGERSPVFLLGTNWDRYAWYLRLPCRPGAAWAGIVRVEAAADLAIADVVTLANQSQIVLPRFASVEYKDPRAPQNLVPIAGLERTLKHRLGDAALTYRALRTAAG